MNALKREKTGQDSMLPSKQLKKIYVNYFLHL